MDEKKYIIFGAGNNGKEVYRHLKKEKVAFFCDNNVEKVGKKIDGVEVISFKKLVEIYKNYIVILAVVDNFNLKRQLEKNNIDNYILYQNDSAKNGTIYNNSIKCIKAPDSAMNQLLDRYIETCERIDTLNEFFEFRKVVIDCKKELNGKYAFYESDYNESMLYGHAKALMDYAKIEIDYANFPLVAHGPFYAGMHPDYRSAAIFSNPYDKQIHNERYPYVPIFTTGPYIQYARTIYDEDTLIKEKKDNGKTAVFFITHSAEQSFVTYDENKIMKQIIEEYAPKYTTVMVCAYWCDIDKDIYRELSKNGVKIVSAGFRFDIMFIHRLRTIMELGDDIFVFGFTSAIVYAINLKKNLYVFNCNESFNSKNTPSYIPVTRLQDTREYEYIKKLIFNKMGNTKIQLNKEEEKKLDLYFGLNIKRSEKEIQTIYEICLDIWHNCNHIGKEYPFGIYRTYQQYQKDYDFDKLSILSYALGKGFWNI